MSLAVNVQDGIGLQADPHPMPFGHGVPGSLQSLTQAVVLATTRWVDVQPAELLSKGRKLLVTATTNAQRHSSLRRMLLEGNGSDEAEAYMQRLCSVCEGWEEGSPWPSEISQEPWPDSFQDPVSHVLR